METAPNKPPILCEEQLGQSHGIDVLAVLVDAHVAGGDLVDEHYIALGVISVLELDVIEDQTLFLQVIFQLIFRVDFLSD